jgi:hypothetical protein
MFPTRLSTRTPTTPRSFVAGLLVLSLFTACHRASPTPATGSGPPAPERVEPERPPAPVEITDGSTLIAAMHDRYASSWYRTLTFVQTTTLSRSGAPLIQTWYEAANLPGRLRIDTNLGSRSGVLYARDSVYSFADSKLVRGDSAFNDLLVLGFDIYTQPAERTQAVLRQLGFDLSKFHEGMWGDQPVYVVGAERGDTTTKQFWVARDKLLFVRVLQPSSRGLSDIRFNKYERLAGGWIAMEVEQFVDGTRVLLEEYRDIKANVPLSTALFDPSQWASAQHWSR